MDLEKQLEDAKKDMISSRKFRNGFLTGVITVIILGAIVTVLVLI